MIGKSKRKLTAETQEIYAIKSNRCSLIFGIFGNLGQLWHFWQSSNYPFIKFRVIRSSILQLGFAKGKEPSAKSWLAYLFRLLPAEDALEATASPLSLPSGVSMACPLVVSLSYSGSATNGVDYSPLPATVTIPAGSNSVIEGAWDTVNWNVNGAASRLPAPSLRVLASVSV